MIKNFSVTNWKFEKLFLSIMLTTEKSIFGCKNCIPFLFFWTKKNVQFWKNENRFVKLWKNRCEHHAHKPKMRRATFVTENVFHSQLHFSNFVEERVGNAEKRKKKLILENTAKIDCYHNAHKSFFRWNFLLLRICFPESISFFIFRYSRPFLRRNLKSAIDYGKQIGHFWPFLAIFGHTKRVVLKALKYLKNVRTLEWGFWMNRGWGEGGGGEGKSRISIYHGRKPIYY